MTSRNVADQKILTWQGIKATIKSTGTVTLHGVDGIAHAGELLAIMGGSGAGKTTLMNVLAHHSSGSIAVSGTVFVNGEVIGKREMQRISAYVQQHDLFCGMLKVKEQLHYSAQLRMHSSYTNRERKERVAQVVKDMNLSTCLETKIGEPGKVKGISVGEKKRLAFACELLTDPSILFCDEPTSGLDSYMAGQVVKILRDMADRGKTIVCVIHQPSCQVFSMFHKVCFLGRGLTAYHGPVGELTSFFNGLGRADLAVPESYNPADHAIRKLSHDKENEEGKEYSRRVKSIRKAFNNHDLGKRLVADAKKPPLPRLTDSARTAIQKESNKRYAAPFWRQFWVLTCRSFICTIRDPVLLQVRIAQIVLTSLAISAVSWRTPMTGPTTRNFEGVLYNVARDMNFLFLFPSITFVCSELPLFFREHRARIYSVEAYYLAKSMAEMPQYTILPLIYSSIVYWATGMNPTAPQFCTFLGICVLQVYVATSIAYAGGYLLGEEGMVITYMPVFVLPMLIFGGFYIKTSSIPLYFRWLSYLSWFRYGFESLEINQWQTIKSIEGCPANGSLPLTCEARDGPGLLHRRAMDPQDFGRDVGILAFFFVAYRIIGFVALFLRAKFTKAD